MDNISVLSWNVRGLSSSVNRNNVKRFVQELKPSFVCLQESMCSIKNDIWRFSMGVFDLSCCVEVDSIGLSGGLISFWDPSIFKATCSSVGRHWICVEGVVIHSNMNMTIYNI